MTYTTLQDALHRALIADPPVATPTPPLQECRDCYGADHCCLTCHGAGWWRRASQFVPSIELAPEHEEGWDDGT